MKKEQSSIWPTFLKNWKYYNSPGKPSKGDIRIVERWLKKIRAKRVLILGSTPQLRDLAAKLKLETYVVDMQMEMLLGMQRYMKQKNDEETIIKSNWLAAPLKESHFDAVLGDLILGNVPHEYQIPLLKKIGSWLKPGGHFITKIFYVPIRYKKNDPVPMINYISRLPRNENRSSELFVHLFYYAYDEKKKILFTSRVTTLMRKYYRKGKVFGGVDKRAIPLFKKIILLWGDPMKKKWFVGNKRGWKNASRVFQAIGYEEPKDYLFAEYFPTVIFRKK